MIWQLGDAKEAVKILFLTPKGDVSVWGFMTVVPMVLGSAICMIVASLLTRPPTHTTIEKYFTAEEKKSLAGGQTRLPAGA